MFIINNTRVIKPAIVLFSLSFFFIVLAPSKFLMTGVVESHKSIDVEVAKSYEQRLLETLPRSIRKRAKLYLPAIVKISAYHSLDPLWVISIVWTESHFKSYAKSSVGARGLMQLMPNTKNYIYLKYKKSNKNLLVEKSNFNLADFKLKPHAIDRFHIKNLKNIEIGVIYLKRLLARFGSTKLATVAYNMGPTWTSRKLRNNEPVGNKNLYLAKVDKALALLKSQI